MQARFINTLRMLCPHYFWNQMPIVQPRNWIDKQGPIHCYTQTEIDALPDIPLPEGFKWDDFDIENDQ